MKKALVVLAVLGIAGVAYADHHEKAADKGGEKKMAKHGVIKPGKVEWQPMDPKNGPWFHAIQGNPQEEAHSMYMKFKAGMVSPWHTHDAAYSAVVVQGTVTHQDQGGELLKATAGQAWTSEGGVNHQNKCLGKTDCVVFIAARGPMSFTMMTADGKKMEMEAAKK